MSASDAARDSFPTGSAQWRAVAAGLLSNGAYRVLFDASNRGFSACRSYLLSAWTADRSEEPGGFLVYLRDLDTGSWCDLGRVREAEPGVGSSPGLEAQPGALRLSRHFAGIEVALQVWVAPDHDCELRELTLHNPGSTARRIELTTFVEIVLHDAAAHASHPIFSKLFLQTEWVAPRTLLAQRRPRGANENFPTLVHALLDAPVTEHESDRGSFLGRGYPTPAPRALLVDETLSGTVGNVLDPALSLRTVVELAPGATQSVTLLLGVGGDRGTALELVEFFGAESRRDRSRSDAMEQERARQAFSGLDDEQAARLPTAMAEILLGNSPLRADPAAVTRAAGATDDLARWGVAATDLLGFVDADRSPGPAATSMALVLHGYAAALGLPSTLVIAGGEGSPALAPGAQALDRVQVLNSSESTRQDRAKLEALATWVWRGTALPPPDVVEAPELPLPELDRDESAAPAAAELVEPDAESDSKPELLLHPIEHGGFAADGQEYVIHLRRRSDGSWSRPPRPWINVLANECFGTLCSETGAGYTWSRNSREHRLTPWRNDSVLDPHSEACYIRDEETGTYWSPLPGPSPAGDHYEMRHGFGASVCHHRSQGLQQQTTIFVPRDGSLRIVLLRLHNLEARGRRLSLFDHRQIVLGSQSEHRERGITTTLDDERRLLLAHNVFDHDSARSLAFVTAVTSASAASSSRWLACGDRESFLGRGGSVGFPRVLRACADLDGSCGPGLDPALTQQLGFELPGHGAIEIALLFGEVGAKEELARVLSRFHSIEAITRELERVRAFWHERLDTIQVTTPSSAIDLMLNGWLTYQTVACRLWARSAFYQSGGAFGFRDQMQDAVAIVGLWPELAREQILLHAAHQFTEGDVLHWWHPPHSRGLRTRFADDLLWLPHLTTHYLRVTGDAGLLDEVVPFRHARPLEAGEDEAFVDTEPSGETATLYEHCCRAIDRSLESGAHGLPLFGSGDWNDGMNRVGREGRGESTWMGFFLIIIVAEWAEFCAERGDLERADRYRRRHGSLRAALELGGWDGNWYRRGYYDDGTPLGSSRSDECQIDALVQAWSVISGAAPPERARQAMNAVAERLIDEEHGIIKLLAPPFVNTQHDPGYIKGYVAGVRENGGQYTHAALWVVRAFAELGDHERAVRLLERISPIHHSRSDTAVARYQVEPYVVAADIYGVAPHIGRGGWTWYTGSAGWMVRVTIETILGITVEHGRWLVVAPRIPDAWPGFRVRYRPLGGATAYEVEITNPRSCSRGVVQVKLDGRTMSPDHGQARIALVHDEQVHRVEIELGDTEVATDAARAAETRS